MLRCFWWKHWPRMTSLIFAFSCSSATSSKLFFKKKKRKRKEKKRKAKEKWTAELAFLDSCGKVCFSLGGEVSILLKLKNKNKWGRDRVSLSARKFVDSHSDVVWTLLYDNKKWSFRRFDLMEAIAMTMDAGPPRNLLSVWWDLVLTRFEQWVITWSWNAAVLSDHRFSRLPPPYLYSRALFLLYIIFLFFFFYSIATK